MKHQTSSLQLCGQPTVLTLAQSTTRFGGSCRIVCTAATWRRSAEDAPDQRVGTFPAGGHRWSGQAVASTSSTLRSSMESYIDSICCLYRTPWFEHTVDILNTDFRCAGVLPFARTHTWQSITPVPIVDSTLMLLSDLTKLAVAVADVDRFCWNLVSCLQCKLTVLL